MKIMLVSSVFLAIALSGCTSVYNVRRASVDELREEGTIVFVRPSEYTLFGTKSMRDYLEIVGERSSVNEAGLLHVQVGLRNRGGRRLWDTKGPSISLSVKTSFYEQPIMAGGQKGIPVYETNWQALPIPRGDTVQYNAISPNPAARYYQITISEILR